MLEQRCVYCSPHEPATHPYTDEHVIPEAFGKFRNSLVLNYGVCDICNQFFANNHDFILGRGSAEAVRRLDTQIKPAEKAGDILRNRVSYSLSTNEQLAGLKVDLGAEDGELVILLLPQVGFRRKSGRGLVYFTERELEDTLKPLPEYINTKDQVYLVYNTDEAAQNLKHLLNTRGIMPQETIKETELLIPKGQEVTIAIKANIDDIIFRAISKIAFNYLVKVAGVDFATKSSFDPIRKYIRYGEKPNFQAVYVNQKPILADDQVRYRQTNDHVLTLEWSNNLSNLIAQVSLFNFATYNIILADNFQGITIPIRSGHLFNIETKEVQTLQGVSSQLLV